MKKLGLIGTICASQILLFACTPKHVEKWGYIDTTGKFVIEPKYELAGDFSEGVAIVALERSYDNPCRCQGYSFGFIDTSGELAISFPYKTPILQTEFIKFRNGRAAVPAPASSAPGSGNGHDVIDPLGNIVGESSSPTISSDDAHRNPVYVNQSRKWGYTDENGNFIIQPRFEFALPFQSRLARVSEKGVGAGVINEQGQYVIGPWTNSYFGEYSEGLMAVRRNGKFGFLNSDGEVKIDFKFSGASAFSEGLCAVGVRTQGLKYGFIDTQGEIVIEPEFDRALDFHGGLAAVQKDGKWGFIDRSGKLAIPATFRWAGSFGDNLAPVQVRGYFDRSGAFHVAQDGN